MQTGCVAGRLSHGITLTRLLLTTFAITLMVLLFDRYRPMMTFILLLIMAAVSRTYNHLFYLPQLGFELYSIATILTGILLGPIPGLLQGMLSNLFATLLSGKIKYYVYISMVSWGCIGFACGLVRQLQPNVTLIGMIATIIYEVVTLPIFIASGARITSGMFHAITHILINLFLFSSLAPLMLIILR